MNFGYLFETRKLQYQEVGCVKVRFSGFDWFCLLYFIFFHCCASFFYAFKVTDFCSRVSGMIVRQTTQSGKEVKN